ncbi:Uncharacterized protein PECH_001941 [Penicillium ucsense]|uniref:Uncharacterized protein n=1 Tax=Penicillium ucsense TaxID=2839758 RepID=A0A8J8W8U0_9EURO|nr:Uncharacterized protein PECM_004259 [Penicillium ucsense]KAF7731472.1 Uncharacterized protein PECH_001941 [Penicillium ucsense]
MKFLTILATLCLSALTVAAPVPSEPAPRGLIPKPMDLIEKMYPHSGIPKIAGKLEKSIGLCE